MKKVSLSLPEKLYLVALFGDIPDFQRARLWPMAKLPKNAGPLVIAEGRRFVSYIARVAARKPRTNPGGRPRKLSQL